MIVLAVRVIALAVVTLVIGVRARATESWRVEVRETAGIERFGYPVSGEFRAAADSGAVFELQSAGKRVDAQFTRVPGASASEAARWSIDFATDLGPLESRRFRIVCVEPAAAQPRRRGLSVERADGKTHVRHPAIDFVVPDGLGGLFERIEVSGDDYLDAAAGLVLQVDGQPEMPLAMAAPGGRAVEPAVIKSGPLAVMLRYAGTQSIPGGAVVRSTAVLEFPLGKSWVSVDWTIDEAPRSVTGLGADVRLRLVPEKKRPVLADVGANGWTYAALRPDEALVYLAEPPSTAAKHVWSVDRVLGDHATPYALPAEFGVSPAPQGWAHLLDDKRCTAIALDEFAAASRDSMRLASDGLVHLRRVFFRSLADGAEQPDVKRLKFWLHVVRSPAQVGAATSPQSMLFPPEVSVTPLQSSADSGE